MKNEHYIEWDVMKGGRFVRTLRMPYNPLFKIRPEDIEKFVFEKLPTLKYAKDVELWEVEHKTFKKHHYGVYRENKKVTACQIGQE